MIKAKKGEKPANYERFQARSNGEPANEQEMKALFDLYKKVCKKIKREFDIKQLGPVNYKKRYQRSENVLEHDGLAIRTGYRKKYWAPFSDVVFDLLFNIPAGVFYEYQDWKEENRSINLRIDEYHEMKKQYEVASKGRAFDCTFIEFINKNM